ncbi:hypothetical protein JAAARDRAFT_51468 [Jaapia argillacea MUCL 33604]|uniref:Uncharacterized protein n=1 Tax=Jaapia argillacea MUCL 33604 TaxID=933084 RepID=A0A067P5P0_9AGAM|nr:hypothetical protein JAAARDRAFT_51468 [Jaapia argillacea MUCL 33604]
MTSIRHKKTLKKTSKKTSKKKSISELPKGGLSFELKPKPKYMIDRVLKFDIMQVLGLRKEKDFVELQVKILKLIETRLQVNKTWKNQDPRDLETFTEEVHTLRSLASTPGGTESAPAPRSPSPWQAPGSCFFPVESYLRCLGLTRLIPRFLFAGIVDGESLGVFFMWDARIQRGLFDLVLLAPRDTELPKSNAVQRKPKQPLKRSASSDSIEEIAGFKDEDVSMKREAMAMSKKGRGEQIVEVIVEGPKPKATCKAKTAVPRAKSLAFSALPAYIQPIYHSKLMPTLIEFYRAEKDPFDPDHGEDHFLKVLKRALGLIFPGKSIDVARSGGPNNGRIYAITRQGLSEWRRSFHTNACKSVKRRITERTRTAEEIEALVAAALEDDGEAYLGEPDPEDPARAWRSIYILETMSSHIQVFWSTIETIGYRLNSVSNT